MADYYGELEKLWKQTVESELNRPWMARLQNGDLKLCHYKGFLLETYHNAGLNPQLQSYTTMFFDGNPRGLVKKFFQHATSEIAHDVLALNDLKNLGVSEKSVIESKPLPTTSAFLGYILYKIQFESPLCYLGYLFHLEYSPVTNGDRVMKMLKQLGVPENALTFLEEHSTVDIGHTKLMKNYIDELIKTEKDFNLVKNSLRDCVTLHNRMLEAAFENGEKLFA